LTLQKDIVLNEQVTFYGAHSILNLNGHTIKNTVDIWNDTEGVKTWSLISVQGNSDVTICGEGSLLAKANDCYAADVRDGSKLTIEGGNYLGNISAVYAVDDGDVEISGGHFDVTQLDAGKKRLELNCYDSDFAAGTATFSVSGGEFVGFDPKATDGEPGAPVSFCAEGFTSQVKTENDDPNLVVYEVVDDGSIIHPTAIELDQSALELVKGQAGKLTATVSPSNYTVGTVSFESSDPAVASVDNNGNISALKAGTATITARIGEHTDTCTVTVVEATYAISANTPEHGSLITPSEAQTGDSVEVTFGAETDYRLKSISVTSGEADVPYVVNGDKFTFTMPEGNVEIQVLFEPIPSYGITVVQTGQGTVEVVGYAKVGEQVSLSYEAAAGYSVGSVVVKDSEQNVIEVNEGKFLMPESDVTITAQFNAVAQTIILNKVGNGTVTVAESALTGAEVSVAWEADDEYEFDSIAIEDQDENVVPFANGKFIMPAGGVIINITFVQKKYEVTLGTFTNGSVTIDGGETTFAAGAEVKLNVTPASGYKLGTLTVTKKSDSTAVTVTNNKFTMPSGGVNVSATFIAKVETNYVYDFMNIDGFDDWGTTYTSHVVEYDQGTVTFAKHDKNGQTITDCPVSKGDPVTFVLGLDGEITSAAFECVQWASKTQTITLYYSTDGGNEFATTEVSSNNFSIAVAELPAGTNAIKLVCSSSNQIGFKSMSLTIKA